MQVIFLMEAWKLTWKVLHQRLERYICLYPSTHKNTSITRTKSEFANRPVLHRSTNTTGWLANSEFKYFIVPCVGGQDGSVILSHQDRVPRFLIIVEMSSPLLSYYLG